MSYYLRIISLIRPYVKQVVLIVALTLFFVLFNNLSLWVSVDFINELFSDSTEVASATEAVSNLGGSETRGAYEKINAVIKSVVIKDNKSDTLLAVCVVIFLTFLLKNICHYFRRVLLAYVELNVITTIRNDLHQKLMHLPLGFFAKRHSGDLTSIAFNDVNAINSVLHHSFGNLILAPIQIFTNVTILFLINAKLALITLTIIPAGAFLIGKIGQSMRRKSRRVFKQIAQVVAAFQETLSAIRIVKAFTNEDTESQKFHRATRDYFNKYFRAQRLSFATSPLNETLFVSILVVLLWYGGNLVYKNQGVTAEDFLRFLLFMFMIVDPLKQLSGINNSLQNGIAAAERIFGVMELEPEPYRDPHAVPIRTFSNAIELKNLSFRYDEDQDWVLKNLNLEICKGDMVAFVGHSGSGKTTLLNLIPRFYEPQQGSISLDGKNLNGYKLRDLRDLVGIVTQDTILFSDTIYNNIAYGMNDVSREEVIQAAKAANAWEFIEQLPRQMDSQIGEKGTLLSGGQKQRLSIARAILKSPDILILDEATSALDSESEKLVQEAIEKLLQNRTVLVIAHRLSTITNASKIVVMNQGAIVDVGTHTDLLARSPIYRNLSQNQFIQTS